jgi:hypothetical protein
METAAVEQLYKTKHEEAKLLEATKTAEVATAQAVIVKKKTLETKALTALDTAKKTLQNDTTNATYITAVEKAESNAADAAFAIV